MGEGWRERHSENGDRTLSYLDPRITGNLDTPMWTAFLEI